MPTDAIRQAVGAWIEVTDSDHAGGVLGFYHFGTDEAAAFRLRSVWPDGLVSQWYDADADQRVRV